MKPAASLAIELELYGRIAEAGREGEGEARHRNPGQVEHGRMAQGVQEEHGSGNVLLLVDVYVEVRKTELLWDVALKEFKLPQSCHEH